MLLGGHFLGRSYTKPATRVNRLLEPVVFINVETVGSRTDGVTVLHEMFHCAGCDHVQATSPAAVASGVPQDIMGVLGDDRTGEASPPEPCTGINIWQVQAIANCASSWVFDPQWTSSERGWRTRPRP